VPVHRERCLYPVLCSRLVVTYIPNNTPFPGSGALAPSDPPAPAVLHTGWEPSVLLGCNGTMLDGHCWQLQPWVASAVGAAPANRRRITTLHGRPGVPSHSPHRRCRPCASRVIRLPGASCHHPKPDWHPSRSPEGQDPRSGRVRPRARPGRSKTPSANESHRLRQGLRPNFDRMGRHWCPGLAAKGPASDMLSRFYPGSARPTCRAAVRRRPAGHMPSVSFCNGVFPEHADDLPAFPRALWQATLPRDDRPLRGLPAGLSQVRGRLASTASTPTRTTARLGGFTPT
jgi:hypothetical protein